MKTALAMMECPRGINHKLDYDLREKRFTLSKILPAGLTFSFDFGFITVSQLYLQIKELEQLPEAILNQLEAFFKNYNEQAGEKFRVVGRWNAKKAYSIMGKARF